MKSDAAVNVVNTLLERLSCAQVAIQGAYVKPIQEESKGDCQPIITGNDVRCSLVLEGFKSSDWLRIMVGVKVPICLRANDL